MDTTRPAGGTASFEAPPQGAPGGLERRHGGHELDRLGAGEPGGAAEPAIAYELRHGIGHIRPRRDYRTGYALTGTTTQVAILSCQVCFSWSQSIQR